ncbi:hypothetical protein HYU15_03985, partial [Candidatus Woesearchaeota archaeon]|nr:hypothetical protein [Candidatus Woesearchaeota archaeon]
MGDPVHERLSGEEGEVVATEETELAILRREVRLVLESLRKLTNSIDVLISTKTPLGETGEAEMRLLRAIRGTVMGRQMMDIQRLVSLKKDQYDHVHYLAVSDELERIEEKGIEMLRMLLGMLQEEVRILAELENVVSRQVAGRAPGLLRRLMELTEKEAALMKNLVSDERIIKG